MRRVAVAGAACAALGIAQLPSVVAKVEIEGTAPTDWTVIFDLKPRADYISKEDVLEETSCGRWFKTYAEDTKCTLANMWHKYGDYEYMYYQGESRNKVEYETAQGICKSMDAEILSVHSQGEAEFALSLTENNRHGMWLGANRSTDPDDTTRIDGKKRGGFVSWEDGTDWDYVNWAPGEPSATCEPSKINSCDIMFNNDDSVYYAYHEMCVSMGSTDENFDPRLWNDVSCNNLRRLVCKRRYTKPSWECAQYNSHFGNAANKIVRNGTTLWADPWLCSSYYANSDNDFGNDFCNQTIPTEGRVPGNDTYATVCPIRCGGCTVTTTTAEPPIPTTTSTGTPYTGPTTTTTPGPTTSEGPTTTTTVTDGTTTTVVTTTTGEPVITSTTTPGPTTSGAPETTSTITTTEEPSTEPNRYNYGVCSQKGWYFADDVYGVVPPKDYNYEFPTPSFQSVISAEGIKNNSNTYCCYKYFGARDNDPKFTFNRAQKTCAAIAADAKAEGIVPNFPAHVTSGLANIPDPDFMTANDFLAFLDTLRKERRGFYASGNPDDTWLGLKVYPVRYTVQGKRPNGTRTQIFNETSDKPPVPYSELGGEQCDLTVAVAGGKDVTISFLITSPNESPDYKHLPLTCANVYPEFYDGEPSLFYNGVGEECVSMGTKIKGYGDKKLNDGFCTNKEGANSKKTYFCQYCFTEKVATTSPAPTTTSPGPTTSEAPTTTTTEAPTTTTSAAPATTSPGTTTTTAAPTTEDLANQTTTSTGIAGTGPEPTTTSTVEFDCGAITCAAQCGTLRFKGQPKCEDLTEREIEDLPANRPCWESVCGWSSKDSKCKEGAMTSTKELGKGDCDASDSESVIPTDAPVFVKNPINAEECARISCSNDCYRGDPFLDPNYDFNCGWSKKERLCKVAKFEVEVNNATGAEIKRWPGGVKGLNPRFTFETEKNKGACAKEMCHCWASGANPSTDDPSGYVYGSDCDVGPGEAPTC